MALTTRFITRMKDMDTCIIHYITIFTLQHPFIDLATFKTFVTILTYMYRFLYFVQALFNFTTSVLAITNYVSVI